ncbi:MAG: hypothetical protein HS115_08275 [Spirochaetales bacterium]|nr:hypothetical protein [Spirochaetales bacterium]
MPEEKQEAKRTADFLHTLAQTIGEFIPVLLERFLQLKNSAAFERLEGEIERLKRRTDILRFRMSWILTLIFLLLLWNIFLTVYVIMISTR